MTLLFVMSESTSWQRGKVQENGYEIKDYFQASSNWSHKNGFSCRRYRSNWLLHKIKEWWHQQHHVQLRTVKAQVTFYHVAKVCKIILLSFYLFNLQSLIWCCWSISATKSMGNSKQREAATAVTFLVLNFGFRFGLPTPPPKLKLQEP